LAINLGLEALKTCNIPFEDEEEHALNNVDKILLRPLPYIFGTKEFFEDDLCGLKEEEKEEEPKIEKEEIKQNGESNTNTQQNGEQEKPTTNFNGFNPDNAPGNDMKYGINF
jgi:hypothetical protein